MISFACLSPIKDSQYFLWFIVIQSIIAFLATYGDATGRFWSYERMFRSNLNQLIFCFIPSDTLMSWYPYQVDPVVISQFHEGLVAVPDQFGIDLVKFERKSAFSSLNL
jgi:hypothetical protein